MKIACYQCDGELAALRSGWNALAAGEPLVSWEWLTSWWRHYGRDIRRRGGDLLVLAAESAGGELIGLAPWYLGVGIRGRVIRFLGSGDACTDYLTVLAAPGYETQVAEGLSAWLCGWVRSNPCRRPHGAAGHGPVAPPWRAGWDLMEFDGVDATDARMQALMRVLSEHGMHVAAEQGSRCWRVAFPPTWEAFLARLSKSHRKQVGRCQRRYLEAGRASLHVANTPAELSRGLEILSDLHGRRRQALGDAGRFADARFAGFLAEASRLLLETGQLRLCWLEIEGKPAAAELHLTGPRTVYAYQSGVDPQLLEHEPGRIITLATLRAALEDGYAAFDFLRGDEPYKAHWRAEPRPLLAWHVVAPRLGSRARYAAWKAARGLRRQLKKLASSRQQRHVQPAAGDHPEQDTDRSMAAEKPGSRHAASNPSARSEGAHQPQEVLG
jgi:CelD/BcsL family acetyltransferase involved in cellulose biosynthesis